jgi:magnesium chelatase family protein
LPIAIGLLLASEQVAPITATGGLVGADDCLFLGERGLDGTLRHTHGILPMVALARERRFHAVFVPAPDAAEAALVEDVAVYPVATLAQLLGHLRGEAPIAPFVPDPALLAPDLESIYPYDLSDVRGQEHVKRALEVAASGGHNILLREPPAAGDLNSRRMPSVGDLLVVGYRR